MIICSKCKNLVPDIGGHNCTKDYEFNFKEGFHHTPPDLETAYERGFKDGFKAHREALSNNKGSESAAPNDAKELK